MNPRARPPILPLGLLATGRRCLVVGGGRVGSRKAQLLLDAGAEVTIVSPRLHAEAAARVGEGAVQHVARPYEPGDLQGAFLVFAATDDPAVNREILRAAREHGTLACSVDASWPEGDFVTPASFRKGDLTVAVASGGSSCRRSRLVKNSLARHVESVETADLLVIGTSHHELPIGEREAFHLAGQRLDEVGSMVDAVWGVHEFALLNTCNRVELLAVVSQSAAAERLLCRILGVDRLAPAAYYVRRGLEAFEHLTLTTSGLLSQTPGENHIVAQIKETIAYALRQGWAAGMMQQWLDAALHISKHIRGDTAYLLHAREIEELCFHYLAATQPDADTRRVMVIGTGVVGRCLVGHLTAQKRPVTWCYHRNRPECPEAGGEGITLGDLATMREQLASVDVIICATASETPILNRSDADRFAPGRTTLVMDLAMPRNVDPQLDPAGGQIQVVDLDDLKHWYRRNLADMAHILELSRDLVHQHKAMYDKLLESFQGRNAE